MTIVPIDKARREAGEWSDEPEGSERPELLKQTNREFAEKIKPVIGGGIVDAMAPKEKGR